MPGSRQGRNKETDMNITNKTVLITGANRGIGRALVDEALRRGAKKVYAGTRGTMQHADPRVVNITLDVRDARHIERAAREIESLDVLINNAGVAIYDDLTSPEVIEEHLAVNAIGPLKLTHALLPLLRRAQGAVVNNLSLASLAPLPIIPGYSISKAAAFSMTQSLRALLARDGVKVHAVLIGPTDTEMSRNFQVPKASPESVAMGIFDGVEKGEDDIFPDPVSQPMAESWRAGVSKTLEREFAGLIQ
jgi:NAD(P)-dependent dehydrogenase (short-subunit alcohol dehydrogenase family)